MDYARLKKSTLQPADLNSYRPISQLPFAPKLVERAVASHFVHHCDKHRLLPNEHNSSEAIRYMQHAHHIPRRKRHLDRLSCFWQDSLYVTDRRTTLLGR